MNIYSKRRKEIYDEIIDENKYKVVATREKEITDEEQIKEGLRDWLWRVDVYLQESSND